MAGLNSLSPQATSNPRSSALSKSSEQILSRLCGIDYLVWQYHILLMWNVSVGL